MRCKGIYRTGRAISVAGEGREGGEKDGWLLRAKSEQRERCRADQIRARYCKWVRWSGRTIQ